MTNVVKLEPVEVGEDYRFDPDETLDLVRDAIRADGVASLLIIVERPDGSVYPISSVNAGMCMIMMEKIKHRIVFEDDE